MIGWLIVGAYLLVALPVFRRAAYIAAYDSAYSGEPKGDDIAIGIFTGAFVALFWPVVVPGYYMWQAQRNGAAILKPPKRDAVAARDRRIAELERELGIR